MGDVKIGTAGWAIPRRWADCFPNEGSTLQRYAARYNAAEINSTFYRSHRPATYERWRASVPDGFRFAVKLPKTITHRQRLADCEELVEQFAAETAELGQQRGPVLIQLPPSLAFEAEVARCFFPMARAALGPLIACEPRHPSWFEPEAESLLRDNGICRVAADPARVPEAALPGGWPQLVYVRLHGSPRAYWSAYDEDRLRGWAERLHPYLAQAAESWIIFDNTGSGAAAGDALAMRDILWR